MKRMRFLAVTAAGMMLAALLPVQTATAATYENIGTVYMAEKFLSDDSKPASIENGMRYIGVGQEPLLGGSYLDKDDKKQGNSSLVQKATSGGQSMSYWMSGDKFTAEHEGQPVNVAAYSNPGLHLWIFVNNTKNIGGDRSGKSESYGSIQIDFGNDSGSGWNGNANRNFWINADDLQNGWNELVFPVKPTVRDNKFTYDGRTIGTKFSKDLDWSSINWFRMNITSKAALMIKIDDIYFCDLGDAPETTQGAQTTTPVNNTTQPANSTTQNGGGDVTEPDTSTDVTESEPAGESTNEASAGESSSAASTTKGGTTASGTDGSQTGNEAGVNPLLIVGIVVGVVAVGGAGVGVFFIMKNKKAAVGGDSGSDGE